MEFNAIQLVLILTRHPYIRAGRPYYRTIIDYRDIISRDIAMRKIWTIETLDGTQAVFEIINYLIFESLLLTCLFYYYF